MALFATLWVASLFLAPYVVMRAAGGGVLYRLASGVYLAGSLVCHQRAARSFHRFGAQLPVCARCSGLYLLVPLGAWLGFVYGRRQQLPARTNEAARVRKWRATLVVAALPTALTVLVEWAGLAPMTNSVRAMSALPAGLAVGWVVASAIAWGGAPEGQRAGTRAEPAAATDTPG